MTQDLAAKIDALDTDTDFSDPKTYADLLGYGEGNEAADQPTQGDTAPATTAAAPEPAPAAASAPAAPAAASADSSATPTPADPTQQAPAAVEGVATKDGKHVIPYAVLEQARKSADQANARAQELARTAETLRAELEAAKAGTAKPADAKPAAPEFTDAELAELEQDLPAVAKLAKGVRVLQEQLAEARAAVPAAAAPQQPNTEAQQVQELIDARPLLVRWQSKGGAVWQDAVALDQQLRTDPQWAGKPMADRFAEVERRIAEELGIPIPSQQQQATSQAPAPAAAPAAAPTAPKTTTATPTLTDLGGGPVVSSSDPLGGMSKGQMVDKAMSMSVEELMGMAGVSY